MKTFAISVLALLTGYCIGRYWIVPRATQAPQPPLTIIDTVRQTRTDTLYIISPPFSERPSAHTLTLPSGPTVIRCDTDSVTLRATTRIYSDSTYRAVVSGVHPSLDSLTLYHPTCTVTRTVTHYAPATVSRAPSRWGLGITAGVTATPSGLSPGVTLGLSYRLWP